MTPPQLQTTRTPGLILQPRDLAMLRLVVNYRFLRSDHIQVLIVPAMPQRVVQSRLQKLSRYGYLRRLYVPIVLDGVHAPLTHSRQPIYTLDSRGVETLRDLVPPGTPGQYERPEHPSYYFLSHHLVVTDGLVALTLASRQMPAVAVIATEPESLLRSKLLSYRREKRTEYAIIPDGAFTLYYAATGETVTFHLEIVRAEVKGGNAGLLGKLRRYVELNRHGFFRDAYGHERLRAVLFATTSPSRARHLAAIARKLTHGRHLFWFGSYQEKRPGGRFTTCFTPDRILTVPWQTTTGERLTILEPRPPPSLDNHRP